jgi:hypothetical protein
LANDLLMLGQVEDDQLLITDRDQLAAICPRDGELIPSLERTGFASRPQKWPQECRSQRRGSTK